MGIPLIIVVIMGIFVSAAVIFACYKKEKSENVRSKIKILFLTAAFVLVSVISYFIGYKTAYDRMEKSMGKQGYQSTNLDIELAGK